MFIRKHRLRCTFFKQLETFNYQDKQGRPINKTNVRRSRDLEPLSPPSPMLAALALICQPVRHIYAVIASLTLTYP